MDPNPTFRQSTTGASLVGDGFLQRPATSHSGLTEFEFSFSKGPTPGSKAKTGNNIVDNTGRDLETDSRGSGGESRAMMPPPLPPFTPRHLQQIKYISRAGSDGIAIGEDSGKEVGQKVGTPKQHGNSLNSILSSEDNTTSGDSGSRVQKERRSLTLGNSSTFKDEHLHGNAQTHLLNAAGIEGLGPKGARSLTNVKGNWEPSSVASNSHSIGTKAPGRLDGDTLEYFLKFDDFPPPEIPAIRSTRATESRSEPQLEIYDTSLAKKVEAQLKELSRKCVGSADRALRKRSISVIDLENEGSDAPEDPPRTRVKSTVQRSKPTPINISGALPLGSNIDARGTGGELIRSGHIGQKPIPISKAALNSCKRYPQPSRYQRNEVQQRSKALQNLILQSTGSPKHSHMHRDKDAMPVTGVQQLSIALMQLTAEKAAIEEDLAEKIREFESQHAELRLVKTELQSLKEVARKKEKEAERNDEISNGFKAQFSDIKKAVAEIHSDVQRIEASNTSVTWKTGECYDQGSSIREELGKIQECVIKVMNVQQRLLEIQDAAKSTGDPDPMTLLKEVEAQRDRACETVELLRSQLSDHVGELSLARERVTALEIALEKDKGRFEAMLTRDREKLEALVLKDKKRSEEFMMKEKEKIDTILIEQKIGIESMLTKGSESAEQVVAVIEAIKADWEVKYNDLHNGHKAMMDIMNVHATGQQKYIEGSLIKLIEEKASEIMNHILQLNTTCEEGYQNIIDMEHRTKLSMEGGHTKILDETKAAQEATKQEVKLGLENMNKSIVMVVNDIKEMNSNADSDRRSITRLEALVKKLQVSNAASQDLAVENIKRLSTEKELLVNKLQTFQDISQELAVLQVQKQQLEVDLKEYKAAHEQLKFKFEKSKQLQTECQAKCDVLERELADGRTKFTLLEREVERSQGLLKESAQIKQSLYELEYKNANLEKDKLSLQGKVKDVEARLEAKLEDVEKLTKSYNTLKDKHASILEKVQSLQNEKKDIERSLRKVFEEEKVQALQKANEKHKAERIIVERDGFSLVEKARYEIFEAQNLNKLLESENMRLELDINKVQNEKEELEAEKAELLKERIMDKQVIDELQQELVQLRTMCSEVQDELFKQSTANSEALADASTAKTEKNALLQELEAKDERIRSLELELDSTGARITEISAKLVEEQGNKINPNNEVLPWAAHWKSLIESLYGAEKRETEPSIQEIIAKVQGLRRLDTLPIEGATSIAIASHSTKEGKTNQGTSPEKGKKVEVDILPSPTNSEGVLSSLVNSSDTAIPNCYAFGILAGLNASDGVEGLASSATTHGYHSPHGTKREKNTNCQAEKPSSALLAATTRTDDTGKVEPTSTLEASADIQLCRRRAIGISVRKAQAVPMLNAGTTVPESITQDMGLVQVQVPSTNHVIDNSSPTTSLSKRKRNPTVITGNDSLRPRGSAEHYPTKRPRKVRNHANAGEIEEKKVDEPLRSNNSVSMESMASPASAAKQARAPRLTRTKTKK